MFGNWETILDRAAYLPPCMNAFVGADITCAVLASGMTNDPATALLCDIGTNGEIALWKGGKLYVTSTAAGPAFEARVFLAAAAVSPAPLIKFGQKMARFRPIPLQKPPLWVSAVPASSMP